MNFRKMKTVNEMAYEYSQKPAFVRQGIEIETMAGFLAGVQFAQRWISVEEELPTIFPSVIIAKHGDKHKAFCVTEITVEYLKNTFSYWRYVDIP